MFRTLELVNAAMARVQATLPPTAKVSANRLTFAAFDPHSRQPAYKACAVALRKVEPSSRKRS